MRRKAPELEDDGVQMNMSERLAGSAEERQLDFNRSESGANSFGGRG